MTAVFTKGERKALEIAETRLLLGAMLIKNLGPQAQENWGDLTDLIELFKQSAEDIAAILEAERAGNTPMCQYPDEIPM
jgi:hypothetical protein